jgi:tRNA (guanine-N7-)-methyltransferase
MPRVRVHQHVNPLSPHYRREPNPVSLSSAFSDPTLPLHLDIGCARGRFILKMAQIEPQWNFLGIEIREPLVNEANRRANEANLTNIHYEFCNAMLWLDKLLAEIPADRLQMVTIQFPDPWFKKKHAKRRMVNAELAETLVRGLANGGRIFVQTDIEFLAEEISELFRESSQLREVEIRESPFLIKTEREKAVEDKGLPVYRVMLEKI